MQSIAGTSFVTTLENDIYLLLKADNPLPLVIFEEITSIDFLGNFETDFSGTTFTSIGGMNINKETAAEMRISPNPVTNQLNSI